MKKPTFLVIGAGEHGIGRVVNHLMSHIPKEVHELLSIIKEDEIPKVNLVDKLKTKKPQSLMRYDSMLTSTQPVDKPIKKGTNKTKPKKKRKK